MGDFFDDSTDSRPQKAKEPDKIEDMREVKALMRELSSRLNDANENQIKPLMMDKVYLIGDQRRTFGEIDEIQKDLYRSEMAHRLILGSRTDSVLNKVVSFIIKFDEYSKYLEQHIKSYKLLLESTLSFIEKRMPEGKFLEIEDQSTQDGQVDSEQVKTQSTDDNKKKPLAKSRRMQLREMYFECKSMSEYLLVFQKYRLTEDEKMYLKLLNDEHDKFANAQMNPYGWQGKPEEPQPKLEQGNPNDQTIQPNAPL